MLELLRHCEFSACPVAIRNHSEAWQQLRTGRLCESLLHPLVSGPMLELLRHMLHPIPGERPACAEIVERAGGLQPEGLKVARGTMLRQTAPHRRLAELREALCRAREEVEESKRQAEATKSELDTLKHRRDNMYSDVPASTSVQQSHNLRPKPSAAKRASSWHRLIA